MSKEELSIPEEDQIENEDSAISRTLSNYVFHSHLIEGKLNEVVLTQSQKEYEKEWESTKIIMIVKDSGVGIPASDQKFLFTLFGKLSSNKDRNKSG